MVLSSAQLPPYGIAASQTILISPDSMEIRFNFFSSKYAIHLLSFEKKGCLIPFSEEEINKKINIFNKKIKKKIYIISAIKNKGLTAIKKVLVSYVHW